MCVCGHREARGSTASLPAAALAWFVESSLVRNRENGMLVRNFVARAARRWVSGVPDMHLFAASNILSSGNITPARYEYQVPGTY